VVLNKETAPDVASVVASEVAKNVPSDVEIALNTSHVRSFLRPDFKTLESLVKFVSDHGVKAFNLNESFPGCVPGSVIRLAVDAFHRLPFEDPVKWCSVVSPLMDFFFKSKLMDHSENCNVAAQEMAKRRISLARNV